MRANTITIDTDRIKDKAAATGLLASSFADTVLAGVIYSAGGKIKLDSDLPRPDDRATDGQTVVYEYNLPSGPVVFIVKSGYESELLFADEGTSIKEIVSEFDTGMLEFSEHLAAWGFDGTPAEAADDETNVRVWIEPNYYAGTIGAPLGHYACDEGHEQLVFDTTAAARAWIEEQESGVYMLSHGEAGRPDYTITA
jgi:hypothetical protein